MYAKLVSKNPLVNSNGMAARFLTSFPRSLISIRTVCVTAPSPHSLCRMVKVNTCDYIDGDSPCGARLVKGHFSTSTNPAVIKAAGHDPSSKSSVSLCNSKGSGCGHSRKAYDVAAAKSSAQTVRLPLSILCSSILTLDLDPRSSPS